MWTKNIACLSGFTITIADLFFQQHGVLSSQHSRGYKFFVEGYIQDVRLHEVELVLKRKCHHSQKKNVKPHSLWFKFTTEPLSIIEAHCYCEVGLSQSCHHLVGLAYYLQDCVLRGHQELSDAPSSTSQAKQWKKPRGTKVIPESVLTTVFYNPTNTKPHKKPVMPRMQVPRVSRKEATHQETIKQFKQAIKQINNNAAMAYILDDSVDADDEMTTFQLHARVRAGTRQVQMPDSSRPFDLPIITSNTTNILIGQPLPPVEDMTLQQCIDLETRTRDQRSSEWHEARRFRFTSSSFGLLCKRKKDFSKEFFETLWSSSQQVQNVPAVQHGRKEETNAITLYMEESGNQVKRCGLVVHPYAPHLGTSPDGVVKTPNGEIGVLEVKCPYTKKATSFKEYLRLKTSHLEEDQNKEICLKFSHNYYYQVQGQMLLTGARWCDFCTYFKHFNHVNIVRVEFDEPFCVEMYRQLTNIFNIYLTL